MLLLKIKTFFHYCFQPKNLQHKIFNSYHLRGPASMTKIETFRIIIYQISTFLVQIFGFLSFLILFILNVLKNVE